MNKEKLIERKEQLICDQVFIDIIKMIYKNINVAVGLIMLIKLSANIEFKFLNKER